MTPSIRADWVCRGASAAPAADPASDSGGETIRDRDLGSEAAQISVPGRLSDQDLIRADITTRTSICHSSITVKHLVHLIRQTERSRRGGEIHTDKYCGLYKPRLRRCSSSLEWPASALDDGLHSLTWGQMLSSRSGVMMMIVLTHCCYLLQICLVTAALQHATESSSQSVQSDPGCSCISSLQPELCRGRAQCRRRSCCKLSPSCHRAAVPAAACRHPDTATLHYPATSNTRERAP